MLDYLNSIACMLLLIYCFPVAAMMQAQHRWGLWFLFVVVVLCLAVQAIDPFATWLPPIGWPAVVLNVIMAVGVTVWHKEAWLFMRCRLGPTESLEHPLRRVSDLPPRGLSHSEAFRVLGGHQGHQ